MALFPRIVEAIVSLHKTYQFKGPVVSLGAQDTILNYLQIEPMLKNADISFHSVPRGERRNTTNQNLLQAGLDNAIHGETFFKMLGLSPYDDIDFCSYNQPSLFHNLNFPVPISWHNRANLLLDCGCLEHVSNFSMGLTNAVQLLSTGGHAIHSHPLNHLVNHGYFQISPILLKDFWEANGGKIIHRFVFGQEISSWRSQFIKPLTKGSSKSLRFRDPECHYWLLTVVKKEENVKEINWPTQKSYVPSTNLGLFGLDQLKEMLGVTED